MYKDELPLEGDFECYNIHVKSIIMGKLIEDNDDDITSVTLYLRKGIEVADIIHTINDYMSWMESEVYKTFRSFFKDKYTSIKDIKNSYDVWEWYTYFDVWYLTIFFMSQDSMISYIYGQDHCMTAFYDNEIKFHNKEVISITREINDHSIDKSSTQDSREAFNSQLKNKQ